MPNSKISALSAATTPLAGTELVPLVQTTTKQVSIANLTAGRAVSGASFAVTGSAAPANGMYLSGTNVITWATNSVASLWLDASGRLGIGAASSGARLDTYIATGVATVGARSGNASGSVFYGSSGNVAGTSISGGVATVFAASANPYGDTSTPPWDGTTFSGAAGVIARAYSESAQYRGSLEFWTETANTPARAMLIDASGNVGIGKTPTNKLHVAGTTVIEPAAGWTGGNTATLGVGDTNNGVQATNGGATKLISYNALEFWTGASSAKQVNLDTNGNLTIVAATGGLGYGTGSGGTVTQATSKSTAVTLNKPSGKITLAADALASNTTVNFLFNNSVLAANDCIVFTIAGGQATNGSYNVWANAGGASACYVSVRNITAGSLSEALVINFSIIRGSAS